MNENKALVDCVIVYLGPGRRWVDPRPQDDRPINRGADVPASACRMLDGSPIADDWPPVWDDDRKSVALPGLVECQVVVPSLIMLDVGDGAIIQADSRCVHLEGSRGRPEYRLVTVSETGEINK